VSLELELIERGAGPPMLYLHGFAPRGKATFLDLLARHGRVVAPIHPGFGEAAVPDWFNGVDDLAYEYLALLERLDWRDVTLIGNSLGAWIACEMVTKNATRVSRLVLADPIGIKVGDRETRDFPDIYALHPDEVAALTYHDRSRAPDYAAMSDEELLVIARAREAGVLYLWEPYMHNPQLRRRLRRIGVPSLVLRGASDGIVSDAYARSFAAEIPGASYAQIAGAGHAPQTEQPEAFLEAVVEFVKLER
jgi:pimeloyl-ACP methyl ester carboxylesterase